MQQAGSKCVARARALINCPAADGAAASTFAAAAAAASTSAASTCATTAPAGPTTYCVRYEGNGSKRWDGTEVQGADGGTISL